MPLLRALLFSLFLSPLALAETATIAVAISLKDAITEIAKSYEPQSSDKIQFNFGSSGQLLAQIKAGAPVDAFISAADKQIDDLLTAKLADPATRRIIAGNSLVLIAPKSSINPPKDFPSLASDNIKRLAIGDPKTVPAGDYAMQVLTALKLSDKLTDRLVYGSNVRQVLDYVERSEVSAGLVYLTDARISADKIKLIATADPSLHKSIEYPAILITASRNKQTAQKFLDYLQSNRARAILTEKGFSLPKINHDEKQ